MNNLPIRVAKLSKRYNIGNKQIRHNTLRDVLAQAYKFPFRRLAALFLNDTDTDTSSNTIWALKDISFDVKWGEVVGIIGHNGAGKSTLLKILSFITEPTAGYASIHGRVGSLLEVGTGFHSELTGRENIYLNGAILGMKKIEIDRKFDEIVAFAEVEKFIDTPAKHYSSGMYVRLAFAVAAHLEPEIMLLDEVLAVGDIDFQKKCIASMKAVANSGRTVLIVSHNMALIEMLCDTVLWLEKGEVRAIGPTETVVADYLTEAQSFLPVNLMEHHKSNTTSAARFTGIRLLNAVGENCRTVKMGSEFTVMLNIEADEPIHNPWIGVQICTTYGQLLFHSANREAGYQLPPLYGKCVVKCSFEATNLLPDRYFINLILSDKSTTLYDEVTAATFFDVSPSDVLGTGMLMGKEYGIMFFPSQWNVEGEQDYAA